MKDNIKAIGGLLLGVTLGAAAGLLMAPASGRKTRNMLKKKSRKIGKEFGDALLEMKAGYNRKIDEYGSDGMNSIKSLKEKLKV